MSVPPVQHPALEVLKAFAVGKLSAEMADSILQHLDTCIGCLQTVTESSADGFVKRMRQAQGREVSASRPPSVSGSLARPTPGAIPPELEHGTIVIENVPADAEVLVDGENVSLTRNGETIRITAVLVGTHRLKIVKSDVELWASDIQVNLGENSLRVYVEQPKPTKPPPRPPKVRQATADAIPTQPMELPKEDMASTQVVSAPMNTVPAAVATAPVAVAPPATQLLPGKPDLLQAGTVWKGERIMGTLRDGFQLSLSERNGNLIRGTIIVGKARTYSITGSVEPGKITFVAGPSGLFHQTFRGVFTDRQIALNYSGTDYKGMQYAARAYARLLP